MTKAGNTPYRLLLPVVRGDGFSQKFRFRDSDGNPVNWDGYSARSQARRFADAPDVIVDFDIDLLEGGILHMHKSAAIMADVVSGVWDLEMKEPGGEPTTVFAGKMPVTKDITKGTD